MNYFKDALLGNDRPGRRATDRLLEALFERIIFSSRFLPSYTQYLRKRVETIT